MATDAASAWEAERAEFRRQIRAALARHDDEDVNPEDIARVRAERDDFCTRYAEAEEERVKLEGRSAELQALVDELEKRLESLAGGDAEAAAAAAKPDEDEFRGPGTSAEGEREEILAAEVERLDAERRSLVEQVGAVTRERDAAQAERDALKKAAASAPAPAAVAAPGAADSEDKKRLLAAIDEAERGKLALERQVADEKERTREAERRREVAQAEKAAAEAERDAARAASGLPPGAGTGKIEGKAATSPTQKITKPATASNPRPSAPTPVKTPLATPKVPPTASTTKPASSAAKPPAKPAAPTPVPPSADAEKSKTRRLTTGSGGVDVDEILNRAKKALKQREGS